MKRKNILTAFILMFVFIGFVGCEKEETLINDTETQTINETSNDNSSNQLKQSTNTRKFDDFIGCFDHGGCCLPDVNVVGEKEIDKWEVMLEYWWNVNIWNLDLVMENYDELTEVLGEEHVNAVWIDETETWSYHYIEETNTHHVIFKNLEGERVQVTPIILGEE